MRYVRNTVGSDRLRESHIIGLLLVVAYGFYGSYLESLNILQGSKGSLRSAEFVLALGFVALLAGTNLSMRLVRIVSRPRSEWLMIGFLLYFMARLVSLDASFQGQYFVYLVTQIGVGLVVGYLAFVPLKSRVFPISRVYSYIGTRQSQWHAWAIVAMSILGLVLLASQIGLWSNVLGRIQWLFVNNEYYQDFSDFLGIAMSCLVGAQLYYHERLRDHGLPYSVLAIALLLQLGLALICVQFVGSNKGAVWMAGLAAMAIYFVWPRTSRGRPRMTLGGISLILLFAISCTLVFLFLWTDINLINFRLGRSVDTGVVEGSGLGIRIEQIRMQALSQMDRSPFLGDLSIVDYMHSSLISVQTHLGFVGSVLFWGFILAKLKRLYSGPGNTAQKAIVPPIIAVSVISSVFYWMPLWFAVGVLMTIRNPGISAERTAVRPTNTP